MHFILSSSHLPRMEMETVHSEAIRASLRELRFVDIDNAIALAIDAKLPTNTEPLGLENENALGLRDQDYKVMTTRMHKLEECFRYEAMQWLD